MMDTDAIYSAAKAYAAARCRGMAGMFETEEADAEIKRLLNEADEEHKSLLAENERLVDEVAEARKEISEQARLNGMGAEREARLMAENAELKAKLTEKASLLRGCYARINVLEKALRELHDATQLVSVGNYDQEAHDIAVSRSLAALEKRHDTTGS